MQRVSEKDANIINRGLRGIEDYLRRDDHKVEQIVKLGVIPRIISLCSDLYSLLTQLQAATCLATISTRVAQEEGIWLVFRSEVNKIVELLMIKKELPFLVKIIEVVNNLSDQSDEIANLFVKYGVVDRIMALIK